MMREAADDGQAAAADDDVEVEVLSQQMVDLTSPLKPPAPKKPKRKSTEDLLHKQYSFCSS